MATMLYVGTAGSDDPTRAGLPFNFALGALEAGHQPQIFLAGEAAYVMKEDVAAAIMPVAMPPLREMLEALVARQVPIFV
ncbi:MAG: DsrE family protein [Candidatus Rokuibacteriota bacterium]